MPDKSSAQLAATWDGEGELWLIELLQKTLGDSDEAEHDATKREDRLWLGFRTSPSEPEESS